MGAADPPRLQPKRMRRRRRLALPAPRERESLRCGCDVSARGGWFPLPKSCGAAQYPTFGLANLGQLLFYGGIAVGGVAVLGVLAAVGRRVHVRLAPPSLPSARPCTRVIGEDSPIVAPQC